MKNSIIVCLIICMPLLSIANDQKIAFQEEIKLKDDVPYNPFKVTIEKIPDSTYHFLYRQKNRDTEIVFTIKSKNKTLKTSEFTANLNSGDLVLDGLYSYNEHNVTIEKGIFKDNQTIGSWYYYDSQGALQKVISYKPEFNGRELHQFYDKNGILIRTSFFLNDQREGEDCLYYPDGQVQIRRNFKSGVLHGVSEVYFTNGALHQSLWLNNGILEKMEHWNENGDKLPDYPKVPILSELSWNIDSVWTMLKSSIKSEKRIQDFNGEIELYIDKSGIITDVLLSSENTDLHNLEQTIRTNLINRKTGIHPQFAGEANAAIIQIPLNDLVWLDTYKLPEDSTIIQELNPGFSALEWEYIPERNWMQKYQLSLIAKPKMIPEDEIFMVVEQMASFPGGEEGLMNYLRNTLTYPHQAVSEGIEGCVFVSCVIDKTGKVCQPSIGRSIHPYLDAEALRVVSLMPNWNPGKQRGQPVNVKYMIPINFVLE